MHEISQKMLNWYEIQARKFPWRIPPEDIRSGVKPNPYFVWLSEVMLQQTVTTTVRGYFEKFINLWETVFDLANAEPEAVMTAWAGLGYYSRARNLHQTAKMIVHEYSGFFPEEQEELKRLKGVGDYTSGAIASIAFDKKSYVVDGNIERIISRLFRVEEYLPKARTIIRDYAFALTPPKNVGNYIQSLMDLGATICLPKNPKCLLCPIQENCEAFLHGNPEAYPKKQPKEKKPDYTGQAFIIVNEKDEILLLHNSHKGLFSHMNLFPYKIFQKPQMIEDDFDENLHDCFSNSSTAEKIGIVKHVFTHFSLELDVFLMRDSEISIGEYVPKAELDNKALPSLMQKIAKLYLQKI